MPNLQPSEGPRTAEEVARERDATGDAQGALTDAAWTTSIAKGHPPLDARAATNIVAAAIGRTLEEDGHPVEKTGNADTTD